MDKISYFDLYEKLYKNGYHSNLELSHTKKLPLPWCLTKDLNIVMVTFGVLYEQVSSVKLSIFLLNQ